MPLFMLLTAFANLFEIGRASMISRCLGAGDRDKARYTSSFCICSAVAVALTYGLLVIILKDAMLTILGTDEGTSEFCGIYIFWTIGIGAVPTVPNAELAYLVRSEGYFKQASFGVAFGGNS